MQKFGRVASTGDKKKGKNRAGGARDDEDDAEGSKESGVVGGRMSRKILDLARDQQEEVMGEMEDDEEDEEWEEDEEVDEKVVGTGQRVRKPDEDEEEDLDEGDVSEEEYAELVRRVWSSTQYETLRETNQHDSESCRRSTLRITKPSLRSVEAESPISTTPTRPTSSLPFPTKMNPEHSPISSSAN